MIISNVKVIFPVLSRMGLRAEGEQG